MQQSADGAVIFLVVRFRPGILILATTIGVLSAPGLAAAAKPKTAKTKTKPTKTKPTKPSTGPTAKQIRTAVAAAERSPDLWATVNVCTSSPSTVVGIRGQMPSLGFTTTLLMNISISYWNYTDLQFEPIMNASSPLSLGKGTHGIHQGGVSFPIGAPTAGSMYLVRGTITFEWMLGAKVLGKVVRNTGHGYPGVNFSSPPGYSSGTCTLT